MTLQATLQQCPASGYLKDECGLPLGWLVCPFAKASQGTLAESSRLQAAQLARCRQCYAYINHLCAFLERSWKCALCGSQNDLATIANRRYANALLRQQCVELQPSLVEAQCPLDLDTSADSGEASPCYETDCRPVYVALIDATGGPGFLELVKSAVLAALEALPSCALLGLATFGSEVALHDVQSPKLGVRRVPLVPAADSPTCMDLQDALPLTCFLAPVQECKAAISAAVESLQPQLEGTAAASQQRGLGPALQAMLRYLGAAVQSEKALKGQRIASGKSVSPSALLEASIHGARVLTFLAGPPNRGPGSVLRPSTAHQQIVPAKQQPVVIDAANPEASFYLPDQSGSGPQSEQKHNGATPVAVPAVQTQANGRSQAFYEDAATAAGALNICIDIWAAAQEHCGLAAMQALCRGCGGSLFLYPCSESATMPQDVYRRLLTPTAMQGLLRVRTSPGLKLSRFHGLLTPDEAHDNLAHVALADPHTTFAFDLTHVHQSGRLQGQQCLQMAFSYSAFVPAADGSCESSSRCVVQRRLRILTMPLPVATTAKDVFEHVSPESTLALLTHKVLQAAQVDGKQGARGLLQDWLARLIAGYNAVLHSSPSITSAEQVDTSFAAVEALQPLARLTYALLYCPLLAPAQTGAESDAAAATLATWSALPPWDLACAVYPTLSSYSDPDTLALQQHSLSRAALFTSGAPIFLLDAFTTIIILYTSGYPQHLPYPPPAGSAVRRAAAQLRGSRRQIPQLLMLREGVDDVVPFMSRLLEESGPDRPGILAFLDSIAAEALQHLQRRT